jgi:hypothetical protein
LNSRSEQSTKTSDARPLSAAELLSALQAKFSANFDVSRPSLALAIDVEQQARALSNASKFLERLAGDSPHQCVLAKCLDEIFGDSICALYLAYCGMNVPARMLLRRSLELGLLVVAYWDSPVDFWNWREHDGDIRFATLYAHLQSDGYKTLCRRQLKVSEVDASGTLKGLDILYRELSNVVHPKPYNFSTAGVGAYSFQPEDLALTLSYAARVHTAIATILSARFLDIAELLHPVPSHQ